MADDLRGFVPFGEYKPDLRRLVNDGLAMAENVIPVYGSYVSSPALTKISGLIGTALGVAFGLHVDPVTGNGYAGVQTKLYQMTEAGVITDVSRGGNYTVPNLANGWQGTSFGQTVIMTNFADEVQYIIPGTPPFANMITSTFAPKAKSTFALRNNLFLANCNVPAPFDTLAAGDHPLLVCWSQTDNIRAFGSQNVTSQLTQSDFQELNFDTGEIVAGVGGLEFGIIAHTGGLTRVDGPPYVFRPIAKGLGTLYPYSLLFAGSDFYYFSPSGLTRLKGGDGNPEVLGSGKFLRSLIDNATGAGVHPIVAGVNAVIDVSMAYDPTNDLIFVAYTPAEAPSVYSSALLVYNISEDRSSYFQLYTSGTARQARFLRPGRQGNTSDWTPGRDLRFLAVEGAGTPGGGFYSKMTLGNVGANAILQKGYLQLSSTNTTRFLRIRPIYNVSDQAAIEQISVTIETTNKPYGTPVVFGPYTTIDTHGWITTPSTAFGDFHAPQFTITANANMYKIIEYEGFEYEAAAGPGYSA